MALDSVAMARTARVAIPALLISGLAACHSSSPASAVPDTSNATTCTIPAPAPSSWRLVADGTQFRDALGRVVFLRGVDAGGRSKFAPYVPFDYEDGGYATALDAYMAHAAMWGIDVMRVPFSWSALEPTQGADDPDWLSRYDQLLTAAWAQGIWTIVDFHQDVYSESFCGDGFPGWTIPDAGPYEHDCPGWQLEYYNDVGVQQSFNRFWDAGSPIQSAYLSAWSVMLARYNAMPGVIGFEPINEPGWGSGDEGTFSATTLTAFYSMMIPFMNAAAPASLVFIDPPGVDGSNRLDDAREAGCRHRLRLRAALLPDQRRHQRPAVRPDPVAGDGHRVERPYLRRRVRRLTHGDRQHRVHDGGLRRARRART